MAKESKIKEIVLSANSSIQFGTVEQATGNMLFIGNFNGICGDVKWYGRNNPKNSYLTESDMELYATSTLYDNICNIIATINNGHYVVFVGSKDSIKYWKDLIYYWSENGMIADGKTDINTLKKVFSHCKPIDITPIYENAARLYNKDVKTNLTETEINKRIKDFATNKIFEEIKKCNMKFANIIQNPPYNKSLHLDFLEKGLDILEENGRMVIVEPATWLINVRKNGKAKRYDNIKKKLNGHVESVKIENLNSEFDIAQHVTFATTTIDMSKTFDHIDCNICGEHKVVESLYDCNLVGKYETIWSILNKVKSFNDMMDSHIWNENDLENNFLTFMDICASPSNKNASSNATPDTDTWFKSSNNGDYFNSFFGVGYHYAYDITSTPQYSFKACGNSVTNKNYSSNYSEQLYGTREELENWKHFILNNKLPLFINIVMTIDQHNNSKEFLPWLVDKQYTDEEINKMFGFTDDEIKLIDLTLKKFERNSPWFKRYMCGPKSVEDADVNNFIQNINEVYVEE